MDKRGLLPQLPSGLFPELVVPGSQVAPQWVHEGQLRGDLNSSVSPSQVLDIATAVLPTKAEGVGVISSWTQAGWTPAALLKAGGAHQPGPEGSAGRRRPSTLLTSVPLGGWAPNASGGVAVFPDQQGPLSRVISGQRHQQQQQQLQRRGGNRTGGPSDSAAASWGRWSARLEARGEFVRPFLEDRVREIQTASLQQRLNTEWVAALLRDLNFQIPQGTGAERAGTGTGACSGGYAARAAAAAAAAVRGRALEDQRLLTTERGGPSSSDSAAIPPNSSLLHAFPHAAAAAAEPLLDPAPHPPRMWGVGGGSGPRLHLPHQHQHKHQPGGGGEGGSRMRHLPSGRGGHCGGRAVGFWALLKRLRKRRAAANDLHLLQQKQQQKQQQQQQGKGRNRSGRPPARREWGGGQKGRRRDRGAARSRGEQKKRGAGEEKGGTRDNEEMGEEPPGFKVEGRGAGGRSDEGKKVVEQCAASEVVKEEEMAGGVEGKSQLPSSLPLPPAAPANDGGGGGPEADDVDMVAGGEAGKVTDAPVPPLSSEAESSDAGGGRNAAAFSPLGTGLGACCGEGDNSDADGGLRASALQALEFLEEFRGSHIERERERAATAAAVALPPQALPPLPKITGATPRGGEHDGKERERGGEVKGAGIPDVTAAAWSRAPPSAAGPPLRGDEAAAGGRGDVLMGGGEEGEGARGMKRTRSPSHPPPLPSSASASVAVEQGVVGGQVGFPPCGPSSSSSLLLTFKEGQVPGWLEENDQKGETEGNDVVGVSRKERRRLDSAPVVPQRSGGKGQPVSIGLSGGRIEDQKQPPEQGKETPPSPAGDGGKERHLRCASPEQEQTAAAALGVRRRPNSRRKVLGDVAKHRRSERIRALWLRRLVQHLRAVRQKALRRRVRAVLDAHGKGRLRPSRRGTAERDRRGEGGQSVKAEGGAALSPTALEVRDTHAKGGRGERGENLPFKTSSVTSSSQSVHCGPPRPILMDFGDFQLPAPAFVNWSREPALPYSSSSHGGMGGWGQQLGGGVEDDEQMPYVGDDESSTPQLSQPPHQVPVSFRKGLSTATAQQQPSTGMHAPVHPAVSLPAGGEGQVRRGGSSRLAPPLPHPQSAALMPAGSGPVREAGPSLLTAPVSAAASRQAIETIEGLPREVTEAVRRGRSGEVREETLFRPSVPLAPALSFQPSAGGIRFLLIDRYAAAPDTQQSRHPSGPQPLVTSTAAAAGNASHHPHPPKVETEGGHLSGRAALAAAAAAARAKNQPPQAAAAAAPTAPGKAFEEHPQVSASSSAPEPSAPLSSRLSPGGQIRVPGLYTGIGISGPTTAEYIDRFRMTVPPGCATGDRDLAATSSGEAVPLGGLALSTSLDTSNDMGSNGEAVEGRGAKLQKERDSHGPLAVTQSRRRREAGGGGKLPQQTRTHPHAHVSSSHARAHKAIKGATGEGANSGDQSGGVSGDGSGSGREQSSDSLSGGQEGGTVLSSAPLSSSDTGGGLGTGGVAAAGGDREDPPGPSGPPRESLLLEGFPKSQRERGRGTAAVVVGEDSERKGEGGAVTSGATGGTAVGERERKREGTHAHAHGASKSGSSSGSGSGSNSRAGKSSGSSRAISEDSWSRTGTTGTGGESASAMGGEGGGGGGASRKVGTGGSSGDANSSRMRAPCDESLKASGGVQRGGGKGRQQVVQQRADRERERVSGEGEKK
uniref:Uncharacterized protein n=1 Tax=Chromera velia CCMP2878 TaxID=1169474 RepID=A0A0G4HK01_9ALVE|eukprot:Cvel_28345.t1-p1 / transcript=Cvel_28345.t1 / gene=Cvel_28345 / organism=Chromera_velia_CCMP2878 / gene_product=hypothetical protein / transcript_product=hypothetical protein / location=Cvel_scaffold3689:3155-8526(-) / protein_length=1691 / sequence_SO=supercontig / SO=protein_coding / is_pseudo=false